MIDSKFADMKNTGGSRWGGAITAAQFIQRFVADKTPWAHLDIAGTGFDSPPDRHQQELGLGLGRAAAGSAGGGLLRAVSGARANDRTMTEILFYHLQGQKLEGVLPALLEKSLERGWTVIVQGASEERIEALDAHLWTYRDDGFLPHGTWREADAAAQPVLLTVNDGNPNAASVRFLIDGAPVPADAAAYQRIVLVFDGEDEDAVAAARAPGARPRPRASTATYWQPDEQGRWAKKAWRRGQWLSVLTATAANRLACRRHRDDAKSVLRDKRIGRPGECVLRRRAVSRIALVFAPPRSPRPPPAARTRFMPSRTSSEAGWFSKPVERIRQARLGDAPPSTTRMPQLSPRGPVAPDELVGADGRCSAPAAPAAPPRPQRPAPAAAADSAGRPPGRLHGRRPRARADAGRDTGLGQSGPGLPPQPRRSADHGRRSRSA